MRRGADGDENGLRRNDASGVDEADLVRADQFGAVGLDAFWS